MAAKANIDNQTFIGTSSPLFACASPIKGSYEIKVPISSIAFLVTAQMARWRPGHIKPAIF
jgi:hypothetical protein